MRFQVANRGENIILKRCFIEIRLARTCGAAESSEVDCKNFKSSGYQDAGLVPPAFLVESAAVSEHDGAVSSAIEIGASSSTVLSGEGDGLLCGYQRGQRKGQGQRSEDNHARIIQRMAQSRGRV
jgi:hypothetical protein